MQVLLAPFATRIAPAWAAICGAVASHGLAAGGEQWLRLAMVVLLVDAGWGTLWAALGGTDWASSVRRWRAWPIGGRVAMLPYAQDGSRGDRLSRWLGQLRAWWRQEFWPTHGRVIGSIGVALPLIATLAALLGLRLVLLSLAAVAVMQLGVAGSRARGEPSPGWDAAIAILLPWLAGHSAFAAPTASSAALAALVALASASVQWAASGWGQGLLVCSYVAAAALLMGARQPIAGAGVLVLLVPQIALAPWLRRGYPPGAFARFARPWLMAAMALAAYVV